MASNDSNQLPSTSRKEKVTDVIQRYQQTYRAWQEEPTKENHDKAWALLIEQLLPLIEEDLIHVAKGYLYSHETQDRLHHLRTSVTLRDVLQSHALSLLADLFPKLATIQIDPTKNAIALIRDIATKCAANQYAQTTERGPRRPKSDSPIYPGTPEALMMPSISHSDSSPHNCAIENLPDPSADNDLTQLLHRLQVDEVRPAVAKVLQREQDSTRRIIEGRLRPEPVAYEDMAKTFGNGVTKEAVKQRFHDFLKRVRRELRRKGLLDDDW